MTKTAQQRGVRDRIPHHDRSLILRLLSERQESGETYVDLETRTGIPASTLASWARRSASTSATRAAFVEVVVAEDSADAVEGGEGGERFEALIASPDGLRRLLVPETFDPAVLQRLVKTLEASC